MKLSEIEKIIEEQGIKEGDIIEMDIDGHNSNFPDYRFRRIAYLERFGYENDFKTGKKTDMLFDVDTRKDVPGFGRDFNDGDNNCASPYSAEKDILAFRKI